MNTLPVTLLLASTEPPAESLPPAGQALWQIALIVLLVLINGFFVAAEFAIVKVRSTQIEELLSGGGRRARLAKNIVEHLDVYLSATQLGITMASVLLSMFGEKYLSKLIEPLFFWINPGISPDVISWTAFAIAFSIITAFHVVIGELMPKSLAIRRSLGTTLLVARPLMLFQRVFKGVIWVFNGAANRLLKWLFGIDPVGEHEIVHSAEELQMLVEESGRSKHVTATERDISINALELNDRLARDIMTPRTEIVYLDVVRDFASNLKVALDSKHTRFPIREGSLDNVPGIVHIKDILCIINDPRPDILKIARPALFVPEIQPLDEVLKEFLGKHAHMALVVDENGVLTGMLTLDDVLEELVGEIQDEFDTEEDRFQKFDDGEFLVDGKLPLYELAELTDLELEKSNVSTLGGYITSLLGRLPAEGEQVELEGHGYEATVTKTDGRRVVQVRLAPVAPSSESPEEAATARE
ncbi:MAG: HlyC/CorC family transporter [Verrucomicrobiales bacterium]|nr:HlyC/CorC family transporter [Verrucomicrobiales bacterium]